MKLHAKRLAALLCVLTTFLTVVPFSASVSAATTYLYREGFQDYSGYEEDQLPEGWSIYNADGDEYCWYLRTDYDGAVQFVSSSWGNRHADEYLMMPSVYLPNSVESNYCLSLEYYNSYPFGGGEKDRVIIYASLSPITDPTVLTDANVVFDDAFYPGTNEVRTLVADLNAYRGQTVYLAIRHIASRIWTFEIDNFAIYAEEANRYTVAYDKCDEAVSVVPLSGSNKVIEGQDFSFKLEFAPEFHPENATLNVTANGNVLEAVDGVYTIRSVKRSQEVVIDLAYAVGDANGDGRVSLPDAVRLFYAVNGAMEIDDVSKAAGNIDTYAEFDLRDAMAMYNYVAGLRDYIDENKNISLIWKSDYMDVTNGFKAAASCTDAQYFLDRREAKDHSAKIGNRDGKAIFYRAGKARVVNMADGYAFTMPFTDFEADYSLSTLRSRYESDTFVLNVSKENSNPYGNNANGWNTYLTEWVNRYVADDTFLSRNDLSRTRAVSTSTKTLSGYTIITYDIAIDNAQDVDMPYYSIAIVRKSTDYINFHLFVLKSATNQSSAMDVITKSFKEFTPVGTAKNEEVAYECKPDVNWNDETLAYYEKLTNQNSTDWGFFTESMSDTNNSAANLRQEYAELSTALDYEYEIMPTYMHIGWGSTMHYFPTNTATEFAGGNGFNGKPVLQFTYQFTTSNNTNLGAYTPMFDIMRGEYDDHFRRLAKDIKNYGAPVLFRLNNEMNTDWTSYCGIVNLLDPDIFVMTWERLYDIFEEEGVDNCIWIYNPVATTTPYCSWGEDLCYLPDMDTVHALGLTAYEMGNGSTLTSFEKLYRDLYKKNSPYFTNYPQIISEFGCGAGGETQYDWGKGGYVTTVLGRNKAKQTAWVKAMFDCFAKREQEGYEFCNSIKGAVWFSVNDYASVNGTNYVTNYFALDDGVPETIAALKDGLANDS